MSVEAARYVQNQHSDTAEYAEVTEVFTALFSHLNTPDVLNAIDVANQPKAHSSLIQNAFIKEAQSLGFRSEAKGLFATYPNSLLRPDYYRKVGETSGIIMEVERGKTTINNMDFLDFWKCHLCVDAHYLFLMVPKSLRQNQMMKPQNEFQKVINHLSPFFQPRNYTNVRGLTVFGY